MALALGMPVGRLASMPESELRDWQRYAARRMFPERRLELALAQIALLIATTMGGAKNAKLSDYLFDPPEDAGDEPVADDALEAADLAEFFGAQLVRDKA